MSEEEELSSALIEATLILAPVKARQAMMTTIAASGLFMSMYGREPSSDAVAERFVKEACDVKCGLSDIQWLLDAGLIHADVLLGWRVANHERA